MFKVGLTGGIGSGKTTIGNIFTHLNIPVFSADNEAKKIINSDIDVITKIKNAFGEAVYANHKIDTGILASLIFNDIKALEKINSIVHPKVHENFMKWVEKQSKSKYVIEEAAILFESEAYKKLDVTINVHADELIRIKRVVDRDNTTLEAVEKRIQNQMGDAERIKLADFTIYNDGKQMVLPQVLEIHHQILKQNR